MKQLKLMKKHRNQSLVVLCFYKIILELSILQYFLLFSFLKVKKKLKLKCKKKKLKLILGLNLNLYLV